MPKPKPVAPKHRASELSVLVLTMVEQDDDKNPREACLRTTVVGCHKTTFGAEKALLAKKVALVNEHMHEQGVDWIPEHLRHVIVEINRVGGANLDYKLGENVTRDEVEELFDLYNEGEFITEKVSFEISKRSVVD